MFDSLHNLQAVKLQRLYWPIDLQEKVSTTSQIISLPPQIICST